MHFGGDPPLFSKPKNWNQQQAQQTAAAAAAAQQQFGGSGSSNVFHGHNPLAAQQPSFHSAGSGASYSSAGSGPSFTSGKPPASIEPPAADVASGGFESVWARMMAAAGAAAAAQQQPQQAAQSPAVAPQPAQPPRENPTAKLKEAFRTAAAAALNKRLHASLTAVAQEAAAQADEQLRLQATLRQRGEQLQSEVAALQVGGGGVAGVCLLQLQGPFAPPPAPVLFTLLAAWRRAHPQAERVALDKLSHDLAASSAQLDRCGPAAPAADTAAAHCSGPAAAATAAMPALQLRTLLLLLPPLFHHSQVAGRQRAPGQGG